MADLSQAERDVIAQNPLNSVLNTIREALRDAEQSASRTGGSDSSATDDDAAPERPRLFAAAIRRLLDTLITSEVAFSLASRTGKDDLAADVLALRRRVQKGDFDYQHYRPLSQLVIKQATDVEIWNGVITLIQIASHTTPPPSIPPSFEGTPITHSSASLQGSEQTRRLVEFRLFEEIRHCTHQTVEGFHAKYFEGKSWSKRANKVWQAVKGHHVDGRWRTFPNTTKQDDVWTWWSNLQTELFAGERGVYHQSTTKEMLTGQVKNQVDIFVKPRQAGMESKSDWKDVMVIGELKESMSNWKTTLLQVSRYVRAVFAHQPTRRFVHAFTLRGTEMETWVFDRSGPYSGTAFDVHEEPEKFTQIFCGYVMMNEEELGLDTFIEKKDGRRFVNMLGSENRGKKRKLELGAEPLAFQAAIVCRGTSCYPAKALRTEDYDCVAKFSWTSDKRPPESDLLVKAQERGVKGLAVLVGHQQITRISDLRKGLVFSKPHKFRITAPPSASSSFSQSFGQLHTMSLADETKKRKSTDTESDPSKRPRSSSQRAADRHQTENEITYPVVEAVGTSLTKHSEAPFDDRILRVLAIRPAGRTINQFRSVVELLEGLRDAIKAHQSLYIEGKILHRDISENNIIITDPKRADGFRGMLIDLDLAKEEGASASGARHRTGTMEFMAIEVLLGISHTYRHDLEAFFYVLLWLCARRGWHTIGDTKGKPKDSMLTGWYTGTYKQIARNKRGNMDMGGLEGVLEEFPEAFECVKPLCRAVRTTLFPYKDGLFTGTPQDPNLLYGPIIEAYDEALAPVKH